MTKDRLLACTRKVLADMARKKGIVGWSSMAKEDLVNALARKIRPNRAIKLVAQAKRPAHVKHQAAAARDTSLNTTAEEEVERSKYEVGVPTKDLSAKVPKDLPTGYGRDRIVVMVRDPYWLHAYWELTRHAIGRAEAALGQEWHTAKPILRLLDVSSPETTSTAESVLRDIEIHGGCNNWYIDVGHPPKSFRVDIGYLARSGRFYVLARSNVVTTPRAGVSDVIDENWADTDQKKADRIYTIPGGFAPPA